MHRHKNTGVEEDPYSTTQVKKKTLVAELTKTRLHSPASPLPPGPR
ncbi:hypothetical protein CDAR_373871, partial [Caerostris darwini]